MRAQHPSYVHLLLYLQPSCHRLTTYIPVAPDDPSSYRGSKKTYYYLPDLHSINEELIHLQLEDDGDAKNPFADEPDQREVQKSLETAKRLKRRWWHREVYQQRAAELEKQLVDKYSPRVKEFVLQRMILLEERVKVCLLSSFPSTHADQLYSWRSGLRFADMT